MTSRVAVHAHDWPIQVTAIDKNPTDGSVAHTDMGRVKPHTSREHDLHVTDTRSLLITELKKPE